VENPADEPASDRFPEQYERLITRTVKQEGQYAESTLQCPECGRLYSYKRSLPGGSYDAMRTWIVERLSPLLKHERHVQKPVPKLEPGPATRPYRCPVCGSTDVDDVGAGTLGGQVFFSVKCNSCGTEDTLDEYQQGDWMR
jgi:ribosomal protein L37AE/L43A